jgi:hypothetical protein
VGARDVCGEIALFRTVGNGIRIGDGTPKPVHHSLAGHFTVIEFIANRNHVNAILRIAGQIPLYALEVFGITVRFADGVDPDGLISEESVSLLRIIFLVRKNQVLLFGYLISQKRLGASAGSHVLLFIRFLLLPSKPPECPVGIPLLIPVVRGLHLVEYRWDIGSVPPTPK